MANNKYICKVCGYTHMGDRAPESCPVCKVPASEFEEQKPKGGFSDKNSNLYIITYASVMVILVAAVLATVSMSLSSLQAFNVLNEKRQAILTALAAPKGTNYEEYITAYAVDANGEKMSSISADQALDLLSDLDATFANKTLPVFEAADGRVVLPVSGSGLWGPIWGYIALEKDMNTVSGVVLDHAGETPGLGAEIATPKHQAQYVGKTIFEGDEFVSIELVKGGASTDMPDAAHEVDGITGGTKTANGVTAMLFDSLSAYVPLLEGKRSNNN